MTGSSVHTADEKTILRHSLDRHRAAVRWKVEGLDDETLRRPMVPSGTSMLGMVKHLAGVEYGWFCDTFGRPTEPMPFDLDEPESDMRPTPDESVADLLAFYDRACAAADKAIEETPLDTVRRAWWGGPVTMRWVLVHMVEETARHAGHMDILREMVDGVTGDHRANG